MIKVNWNINKEEKDRILNLHEVATKNQYLIYEQQLTGVELNPKDFPKTKEGKLETLPPPSAPAWDFCGYYVYPQGGRYFMKVSKEGYVEIPKLSELEGELIDGGKEIKFDDKTLDAMDIGVQIFNDKNNPCFGKKPNAYWNYKTNIVYFDDVKTNLPCFGVIGWKGDMRGDAGDLLDVKPQKDKEGVKIKWGRTRSKSFVLELGVSFRGTPMKYKEKPEKTPPQEETLSLNVDSPFNFDNITLTNEAEKQFQSFVEKVKEIYKGVGGNVEVITSSSIDGDPEQTITGAYPDCKNSGTRKQYDFCLSKKRAESIAERLKSSLPETKFNFIAKPIGETDQFAPGKKWPEIKNSKDTSGNRKLIINLPKITIEKK